MARSRSPLGMALLVSAALSACHLLSPWLVAFTSPGAGLRGPAGTTSAAAAMGGTAAAASAATLAEGRAELVLKGPPRRPLSAAALDPFAEAAAVTPPGVEFATQALLGLAALYGIMSVNEYIYHRYFQHLGVNKLDATRLLRNTFDLPTYRGDGHVEHHRETLDDMSLKRRPDSLLDPDPFRGTAFPWWATTAMTISVLVPAYPVLSLIGWSGPVIVTVVCVALLLHALLWNSLHPHMHGLPDVELSQGAPSFVLAGYRDSPVFSWLRQNHEGHHRAEGAHGNYNVCCPLVDSLVGTHVGVIPAAEVPIEAPVAAEAAA